jgi:hypothetical protein
MRKGAKPLPSAFMPNSCSGLLVSVASRVSRVSSADQLAAARMLALLKSTTGCALPPSASAMSSAWPPFATKLIRVPSCDHRGKLPAGSSFDGTGLSGSRTQMPPSSPVYAMRVPSGDQSGDRL